MDVVDRQAKVAQQVFDLIEFRAVIEVVGTPLVAPVQVLEARLGDAAEVRLGVALAGDIVGGCGQGEGHVEDLKDVGKGGKAERPCYNGRSDLGIPTWN